MKATIQIKYDAKAIRDLKREGFRWDAETKTWWIEEKGTIMHKQATQYYYDRAMASGNVRFNLIKAECK